MAEFFLQRSIDDQGHANIQIAEYIDQEMLWQIVAIIGILTYLVVIQN